jgi:hypothetical protein
MTRASGRDAQLWAFRDHQVVRWKVYRDEDDALEAMG